VGDPVENDLPRSRLGSLNSVPLRLPVQEDVQFRNFSYPPAVDFPVELNRELHRLSLPPIAKSRAGPPAPRRAYTFAAKQTRWPPGSRTTISRMP